VDVELEEASAAIAAFAVAATGLGAVMCRPLTDEEVATVPL